ncbi:protease Do-like 7 isoform X2 [Populus trichocarpa]|uniref:protease Do-like 7 isoform X2 n=1 Tax=Populus trichocarpa TaxID=3694 RepID=UPI0022786890|nr:protease Do-like 7 isoform X2 [Populus trichocarpa]
MGFQNDMPFLPEKEAFADDWAETVNKVVPAVVVLQTTTCRAFDTELPSSGSATGFVVDKQRGIILTNRHVVNPGPVNAQAIFVSNEETPLRPIYRDPVHDFGFFSYDPGAIQFLNYEEIPLAPEAASVGLEIRVIGNDSSEKVSILSGILARLDRNAPAYEKDGYNDFNTFYLQAASGTKPGSSGSPVIDKQGRAVALNAGSSSSSSSAFYLPLERVVRALRLLQKCKDARANKWETVSIPRGTLQVTFCHKGFDETRRLGLRSETEQMVRNASLLGETGMLVVDSVVPGGPAYGQLEPGDMLVSVDGELTTRFLKLETLLDDNVDQKIGLQIERGGISLTVNLTARNFSIQCGLVYVAEPGYMLQRSGVPCHAIIKKFSGVEISQLEELISVFSKLSRGARVPLEYIRHNDRHRAKSVIVCIDRHEWYDAPKIYTRDDSSGLWIARPAIQPKFLPLSSCSSDAEQHPKIQSFSLSGESTLAKHMHQSNKQELTNGVARIEDSNGHISKEAHSGEEYDAKTKECQEQGHFSSKEIVAANCSSREIGEIKLKDPSTTEKTVLNGIETATSTASFAESLIEPALVTLEVDVPPSCLLDGVKSVASCGTGVIVHHSQCMGLVAIDKNTVEISACDVILSFAAFPIQIPGEVVFVHPVYNFALVGYDPSALGADGASMVHAAELLPEPALCRGDRVYLVGLSKNLRAQSRKSTVTNPCLALYVHQVDRPRYGATNMEVIELDSGFGSEFTGVLCDERGKVRAIWGSFSNQDYQFVRGIPIYMISQIVDSIVCGGNGPSLLINGVKRGMPLIRTLEVSLCPMLLSEARNFGLSNDWIQALDEKDPVRRQVLCVEGSYAGSKAENVLKQSDMLLAVNKESITCFRDIENACQALEECGGSDGKLKITVFRQGCEVDLLVGTDVRDGNGTTRAISWCGCLVQDSHPAVRTLGFLPDEGYGVFVTKWSLGSPADRYCLSALKWIVQVNGKPTSDLDAFANVVKELGPDECVRVKTVDLDGKPQVQTLKQDLHYWPTWELRFDPDTAMWRKNTINALDCSNG